MKQAKFTEIFNGKQDKLIYLYFKINDYKYIQTFNNG